MRSSILLALPAALLVVGCTPIDMGLGEAARHNIALQTLDPDPQYEGVAIEGASGDRSAAASKRYREGKVIEPVTYRTTSGSGAGGGGGGGGGGGSSSGGGPK